MAKPCRVVNNWAWFSGTAFLFALVTIHVLSVQKGLRTRKFRTVSLLSENSKAAVVDIMGMLGVQNSNSTKTEIDDSYASPSENKVRNLVLSASKYQH